MDGIYVIVAYFYFSSLIETILIFFSVLNPFLFNDINKIFNYVRVNSLGNVNCSKILFFKAKYIYRDGDAGLLKLFASIKVNLSEKPTSNKRIGEPILRFLRKRKKFKISVKYIKCYQTNATRQFVTSPFDIVSMRCFTSIFLQADVVAPDIIN